MARIAPCLDCGWQHKAADGRAVGIFSPGGPVGYLSAIDLDGPLHPTREAAVAATCATRAARRDAEELAATRVCLRGTHLLIGPMRRDRTVKGSDCPSCLTRPSDFPPVPVWTIGPARTTAA